MTGNVLDLMKSGELARLHPTVPDSKKEEKATAILLSTFRVVPSFSRAMLEGAGVKIGKRSQVECYTEVALEIPGDKRTVRPDGLIVITLGKKVWSAFVEAKTGNAELRNDQCEEYLGLAKKLGIDAVITISNQYSAVPTHHPVQVSKIRTRKVGFYHFSWLSIMSTATLQVDSKEVNDPEQAFMLTELTRFLKHPASGVSSFNRMGKSWTAICSAVKQGEALRKNDPALVSVVMRWHQLIRFLALELTVSLSQPVHVKLSRKHANDASSRVADDVDRIVRKATLKSELSIPNAASTLLIAADLRRRTINLGMRLDVPQDKKRAPATITWLLRQLKDVSRDDLLIRAAWPRRMPDTTSDLARLREDNSLLIPDGSKELPQSFEVIRVIDLAGKFSGVKTFVEYACAEVPTYYKDVGEHLRAWVPPPPKLKRKSEEPQVEGNASESSQEKMEAAETGLSVATEQPKGPVLSRDVDSTPDYYEN